jgi:hypothetical protein
VFKIVRHNQYIPVIIFIENLGLFQFLAVVGEHHVFIVALGTGELAAVVGEVDHLVGAGFPVHIARLVEGDFGQFLAIPRPFLGKGFGLDIGVVDPAAVAPELIDGGGGFIDFADLFFGVVDTLFLRAGGEKADHRSGCNAHQNCSFHFNICLF